MSAKHWLVSCSCGWTRECSSQWPAESAAKLHPKLGDRTIDLRPQVVAALKAQRASSQLKSEYIFPNAIGGPLDRDNLTNRVWYPSLRRADLKSRKPYQTRHTFTSLALSAGEEIGWVAKQLGHVNAAMIILCRNT